MQHVLKYIDFKDKFDSLTRTNSGSIELLDLSIYEHSSKNASMLLDIDPVSRKFQQADESLFAFKTMAHVPNITPLFDECENYLIDCSNKQFCKDLIYTRLLYATKLMNRINRVTKSGKISADDLLAIISKSIGLVAITKDNMNAYRESMTFKSIHQLKSQNQKVDSLDLDESDFILNVYRTVDGEYVNAEELMNELVVEFAHTLLSQTGYKGTSTTFKREYKNVYPFLGKRSNVVVLPKHIIKFRNCLVNVKTNDRWDGPLANTFALNQVNYNYKPLNEVCTLYLEQIKQMFKDWSNNSEDMMTVLKNLVCYTLEGNGRQKVIILESNGGGGKSTYQKLLQSLIHKRRTQSINFNDLDRDSSLENVDYDTHLIIGDDLSNKTVLNGKALSALKSLTSNGEYRIFRKYLSDKIIRTSAVWIQNTNHRIQFDEFNQALNGRLVYLKWTNADFRKTKQNNQLSIFLDQITDGDHNNLSSDILKQKKDFLEALIAYCMNDYHYTSAFDLPESIENASKDSINEVNHMRQFVDHCQLYHLLEYQMTSANLLYLVYKQWCSSSGIKYAKSLRNFISEFTQELDSLSLLDREMMDVKDQSVRYARTTKLQQTLDVSTICQTFNIPDDEIIASTYQHRLIYLKVKPLKSLPTNDEEMIEEVKKRIDDEEELHQYVSKVITQSNSLSQSHFFKPYDQLFLMGNQLFQVSALLQLPAKELQELTKKALK